MGEVLGINLDMSTRGRPWQLVERFGNGRISLPKAREVIAEMEKQSGLKRGSLRDQFDKSVERLPEEKVRPQ